MTRIPLRPLPDVLAARDQGIDPNRIERANVKARRRDTAMAILGQTQMRVWMLTGMFCAAFCLIGFQMMALALSEAEEPKARATTSNIFGSRADIVDRNGRILATNIETFSLYAHPHQIVDAPTTALKLAEIFPDETAEDLLKRFQGGQKFIWIKKSLSPEEKQAVHDIGEPGLHFGPREMRLYPNGKLASHILGGASYGEEGTHSAEVIGVAGVEKAFDPYLRNPSTANPLQLSIDLTVQAALEKSLFAGMRLMNAKGATAVLMDARTGEIAAMASLPDYDPNARPQPLTQGDQADSPLFNRSVQGLYELGSSFKPFTIAQAIELGLVSADTKIDTSGPLKWGRFKIRDFSNYGPSLSVEKVLVKSSNIGTARIAMDIGNARQKAFLEQLGLLEATPIEMIEAPTARPQYPSNWSEISTMTISYGHGISTSPVHLAAAYATIANGGTQVKPTLVRQTERHPGPRVISELTSVQMRGMMRKVVTEGTASFAEVPGYAVAGKTGTADKPKPNGGYYDDRVLATFSGFFPANDPKYVVIVTLDEPEDRSGDEPRRTAGWTAVPVAADVIRRVAPLLGVSPVVDASSRNGVTLAAN